MATHGEDQLKQQQEFLLSEVRELGQRAVELYGHGEKGRLDHYQRLSATLDECFGDGPLSAAGFLHGIPTSNLRPLLERNRIRGDS